MKFDDLPYTPEEDAAWEALWERQVAREAHARAQLMESVQRRAEQRMKELSAIVTKALDQARLP